MSWENGDEIDSSFWSDRLQLPSNTNSIEDAVRAAVFTSYIDKVVYATEEEVEDWRQFLGRDCILDFSDPTKSAGDINREIVLENGVSLSKKRVLTIDGYTVDELRTIAAPILSINTECSSKASLVNGLRAWYFMEGTRIKSKSKSPPPSQESCLIKRVKRSYSPVTIKTETESVTVTSSPSASPTPRKSCYSYCESELSIGTACTFESTHDEVTSAIALANTNKLPPHKYTEVVLAALASQYPIEMVRKGAKRFLNYY